MVDHLDSCNQIVCLCPINEFLNKTLHLIGPWARYFRVNIWRLWFQENLRIVLSWNTEGVAFIGAHLSFIIKFLKGSQACFIHSKFPALRGKSHALIHSFRTSFEAYSSIEWCNASWFEGIIVFKPCTHWEFCCLKKAIFSWLFSYLVEIIASIK